MAHVAFLDHVDSLSLIERHGSVRSMIRKARVQIDLSLIGTDKYTVLQAALSVCPAAMSTLADIGLGSLVLVEREPALIEKDPGWVDVILKYEHILDGPNQVLGVTPTNGLLFGKGKASIRDKPTNFYYPNGDLTKPKIQILTGHTYPAHEALGVVSTYPGYPNLVIQGGEINIPFPEANFTLQGISSTRNPWGIARTFIAATNGPVAGSNAPGTWMGYPPYYWLCSEVQFEVIDVESFLYKYQFEFQYNSDTWLPWVVFEDQRFGKPPAGVLQANVKDNYNVLSLTHYPFTLPTVGAAGGVGEPQGIVGDPVAESFPLPIPGGYPILFDTLSEQDIQAVPAGLWQVPCLRSVNFDALFQSYFEGENVPATQ